MENAAYDGYQTEKLPGAMLANAIPIYWGNPAVGELFNTKSFINLNQLTFQVCSGVVCILVHNRGLFESLQEALDQIKYLDSNDTAYVGMLSEPWLPGNALDPRKHIVHDDHIMSAGRPLYPLCISCVVHRAR